MDGCDNEDVSSRGYVKDILQNCSNIFSRSVSTLEAQGAEVQHSIKFHATFVVCHCYN